MIAHLSDWTVCYLILFCIIQNKNVKIVIIWIITIK